MVYIPKNVPANISRIMLSFIGPGGRFGALGAGAGRAGPANPFMLVSMINRNKIILSVKNFMLIWGNKLFLRANLKSVLQFTKVILFF
ncbi:hypothetical protein EM308_02715 [Flavobacterium gilvum]|uniref:Uncharacterized protein n=1 Tax=Flavobacterium gilvum TaxID=1492737 RepID=A0AAC9I1R1_9FLAO|nr:hypothetical protein EM308_02715 [Flavobacterium gilvum]